MQVDSLLISNARNYNYTTFNQHGQPCFIIYLYLFICLLFSSTLFSFLLLSVYRADDAFFLDSASFQLERIEVSGLYCDGFDNIFLLLLSFFPQLFRYVLLYLLFVLHLNSNYNNTERSY